MREQRIRLRRPLRQVHSAGQALTLRADEFETIAAHLASCARFRGARS